MAIIIIIVAERVQKIKLKPVKDVLNSLFVLWYDIKSFPIWFSANCPDGMEFFETTGSCYTLTSSCTSFYYGRTICTSWALGVHVVDVYTEAENDIVKNYRLLTGKFFTVI
jgi:hypothetical protein